MAILRTAVTGDAGDDVSGDFATGASQCTSDDGGGDDTREGLGSGINLGGDETGAENLDANLHQMCVKNSQIIFKYTYAQQGIYNLPWRKFRQVAGRRDC